MTILPENNNKEIINNLTNELNGRINDIKTILPMINYSTTEQNAINNYVNNNIFERHKRFNENIKLSQSNKLWRYALSKQEEQTGSIFDVWMQAQKEIKSGTNSEICKQNGVVLKNIKQPQTHLAANMQLLRAQTARNFQTKINNQTDAMYFLGDHHGQYENDEDNEMQLNLSQTYSNVSNVSTASNSKDSDHKESKANNESKVMKVKMLLWNI